MMRVAIAIAVAAFATTQAAAVMAGPYDSMIATHAAANGVPEALVRRVIVRESRYNPHAVSKGNYGMMQIKLATARGVGYSGNAQGLLDADTNLTYAVKYLAGAYRAAHGNHDLAVRYYAGGYYYAAKRQGWNANAQTASTPVAVAVTTPAPAPVLSITPPGAAKPTIVTDAAHASGAGDPLLFTLKNQQSAEADNVFAPVRKSRRASRAERALRVVQ